MTSSVSLADFRFAAMLRSPFVREMEPPAGFYPAFALHRLMWAWNVALETEGTEAPRYSPAFDAPFTSAGVPGFPVPRHTPVPFTALPYGLQVLLGGGATDAWYAAAALDEASDRAAEGGAALRALGPEVRALVASTWSRRFMPVAELRAHLLSEWAVSHLWSGAEAHLLVPAEWGFQFETLMAMGRPGPAPVVFYDGALHRDSVLYGLALLRFAWSDVLVPVLEGSSQGRGGDAPIGRPAHPASAWTVDGSRLRSLSDPVPSAVDRDILATRGYREASARSARTRDAVADAVWAALRIPETLGVAGVRATPRELLPYRTDTPSLEDQTAWTAGRGLGAVPATRGGAIRRAVDRVLALLPDVLAPAYLRDLRRMEREARARAVGALRDAKVVRFLPEVDALLS